MPGRSRSASRGRAAKRQRAASGAVSTYIATRRLNPRRRRLNRVRAQGTHNFSRYCAAQEVSMNGFNLSRQYSDKFEDLIQSSDFTTLFDMYRIVKITYKFQLINNPNAVQVLNAAGNGINDGRITNTNWYPKMWYIMDYDGGATETLNSIRERQGVKCRILQPNKEIRVSWTPKCRVLTYATDTTQGYAPRNIKIDMNDTAIPHYGLAVVFDSNGYDPSDLYPFKISIERKFTFQCYGVR